ncbi:hypothetical protein CcI49_32540 [Frankia sp. CcI49]|uniref:DUF2252 domain-containing protein n=1 Tax=unclassified Frankia TaxID=2632575 RepID=UPI0006CA21C2|nr:MULTISPECIES: DUF2252 domain-containing protein [unclassified Frankia]KPM55331.1 hypothetical protein ACG83_07960 [Frankia sp. R43]ONH53420.1 hypothetical protein CcI49_32540 [Frankia sp. CcI49]
MTTSAAGADRAQVIGDVFGAAFGELMAAEPGAFRRKFRKMAASPFAFYRGSAALFYTDINGLDDPFLNERTSRVWIHGDLHAENFGTYMSSNGVLVFNVNDFDEAYVGPFTWDLRRLVASLALLGRAKALSDAVITDLVEACVGAYQEKIRALAEGGSSADLLTRTSTEGVVHAFLQTARRATRVALLDELTVVENYDRRFAHVDGVSAVDDETRAKVIAAFDRYLATVPPGRRTRPVELTVKDVVLRRGVGIGSAGLPSYSILVEGHTEALDNDVVLYMKQAQSPAVSRFVPDERIAGYFHHQGHRTAVSQRALQADSDSWLGYSELDGIGQLVAEVSPYAQDLDWSEVNERDEMLGLVADLGRSTARMHAVADDESDHDLVSFSTEDAIHEAISADPKGFTLAMVEFAHDYGAQVHRDHALFVDMFRNGQLIDVD